MSCGWQGVTWCDKVVPWVIHLFRLQCNVVIQIAREEKKRAHIVTNIQQNPWIFPFVKEVTPKHSPPQILLIIRLIFPLLSQILPHRNCVVGGKTQFEEQERRESKVKRQKSKDKRQSYQYYRRSLISIIREGQLEETARIVWCELFSNSWP